MSSSEPCAKCLSFLAPKQTPQQAAHNSSCCPVCLGLWDQDAMQSRLESAIRKSAGPYGGCGNKNNRFSQQNDSRLISLPGDVVFRYHTASQLSQYKETATRLHVFVTRLKQYGNDMLAECLDKLELERESNKEPKKSEYPECVTQEEQGYLALNVMLATPNSVSRPSNLQQQKSSRKGRRKQYQTQGGHPRTSLEQKLELEDGVSPLLSVNQAVELTEKQQQNRFATETDWFVLEQDGNQKIRSIPAESAPIDVHIALWRRPFLVQGRYTKTRRDVSQTPFFVSDDDTKKRKRLGTTSIEELILPPLTELCGGISTINNSPNNSSNVLYGMAKFHASGREDMDVRMILPSTAHHDDNKDDDNYKDKNNNTKKLITGRPFCCEIIDALRMPTVQDLKQMVHIINHKTGEGKSAESLLLPESNQYYGRSPMGVGVDPTNLSFAPGSVFKNLQSETESKHKFYGCLCWSEKKLPPLEELTQQLTTDKSKVEGKSLFPLELKQRTPIRVLHRRANAIRIRHILSCHRLERLDDHYFRIHISTDAGTYVKEYCHGDLGRTQPNVSTLLDCGSIDILELDCEGIQIN